MSIYKTSDGFVDINNYDADQRIIWRVNNPDAVLATEEEQRESGFIVPMSEITREQEEVRLNEIEKLEAYRADEELDFARIRDGFGDTWEENAQQGKGKNVTVEDFEYKEYMKYAHRDSENLGEHVHHSGGLFSDKEHDAKAIFDRYKKWINGQDPWSIDNFTQTLDEQITTNSKLLDLDIESNKTNYYYADAADFVKKYYDAEALEAMGIDIRDFEGFLEKHGMHENFKKFQQEGTYDVSAWATIDVVGNEGQETLDVAKQRSLNEFLYAYMDSVNEKVNGKMFYDDYVANPDKYKDFENYIPALTAYQVENGYFTNFDYDAYRSYYNNNFTELKKREETIEQLKKDYLEDRGNQNYFTGAIAGFGNTVAGLLEGAYHDGVTPLATWLADVVGMDGTADQMRLLENERKKLRTRTNMSYFTVDGKGIKYKDGKEYVLENGELYDITTGLKVDGAIDEDMRADIVKEIQAKGVDMSDHNARGFAVKGSQVLGNIGIQLLGTKGMGSLRSAASLRYLAAGNGFKNAAQYKKYLDLLQKNPTRLKQFGSLNQGTFGVKLPFDARIVDATMFQAFYGVTQGHERTLQAALDANIPYDEAESLANIASLEMGILYGLTGPINPRLPGLNAIDDWMTKSGLLNKVINAYKEGGKKQATSVFRESIKKVIPTKKGLMTFMDQGMRETIQENIQQVGEQTVVNYRTNQRAKERELVDENIINQTYTTKQFYETSLLSFAAGGLVGSMGSSGSMSLKGKKSQIFNMAILGKNMKNTRKLMDFAVQRGRISREKADQVLNDIQALNKVNTFGQNWLMNSPDELIEIARTQESIRGLKNQLKKANETGAKKIKAQMETLFTKQQELVDQAAATQLNEDVDNAAIRLGKDNVVRITDENMGEFNLTQADFESDGWFATKDGKVYINMTRAAATKAVTVGSHEMLHKILYSAIKADPKKFRSVVDEFKEILESKGIYDVIEARKNLYAAKGIDIDSDEHIDEYFTIFADALAKNDIIYEQLQENEWLRIGRRFLNEIKRATGLQKAEFETGQQAYDFILDYHQTIKKGKTLNRQAQRLLDAFTPDEEVEGVKKKSYSMEAKINQDTLDNLVNKNEEFIGSQAHVAAKALIDNGSFDGLIGAKLAQGDTIYGKPRQQVIEEVREELKKHLEKYNPTVGTGLFGYLNSYIGFKTGTVTNRLKRQVKTRSIDVDREGKTGTQDIEDTSLNPEEIMIAKEQAALEQKTLAEIKLGKQIDKDTKDIVLQRMLPLVRDIDSSLMSAKSINAKNSPLISELKSKFGNSLVYDAMISWLGTRAQLRENLLKIKEDVLQNSTTTWLMGKDTKGEVQGGIPQAIDKVIKLQDGSEVRVPYPDWVGKKIAREKMGTDNAGRTSGHDLVYRSETELDDNVYLSRFYDANGKLIRGRKEALAKHLAQEVGIEYLIDEIVNNPNGAIATEFSKNQYAKGVLEAIGKVRNLLDQADRGGIKRSISNESIEASIEKLFQYNYEGNAVSLQLEKEFLIDVGLKPIVDIFEEHISTVNGYIDRIEEETNKLDNSDKTKKYRKKFLKMNSEQKIKALGDFSSALATILPPEVFNLPNVRYDFLGIHDRVINPKSKKGAQIIKNASKRSTQPPAWLEDVRPIFSNGGIINSIATKIHFKSFESDAEAQAEFDRLFAEDIAKANIANPLFLKYIIDNATKVITKKPQLIPGYLAWFQQNTSFLTKGLRAFGKLQDVEIYAENMAPFVGLDGKGHKSITKDNRKDYESGKINRNYNHPLYTLAKKRVDDRRKDLIALLGKTTAPKKIEEINKKLEKDTDILYREFLRIYTEHKNPSSNKFADIGNNQLDLVSKLIDTDIDIDAVINAHDLSVNSVIPIISDFTMTINTAILSKIQDEVHSKTSNFGDARVFALDKKYIKKLYPIKGYSQALQRGQEQFKIDVDRFIKVLVNQKVLDESRKRSFSADPKGMSIYDFDDTLAFSDSKIIVTMPNGKVKKITPAQFAAQDETLKAQGATFDFSEFNKVVKGRPGPLAPRLKKAIEKFGNQNIFVLTARPQASAEAIYEFLKGIGLEIPLENIVGLENGTPAAKAGWIVNKVAQGFNDFYFVDDAYKNVKAVQDVLSVFDVKSKVQIAEANRKRSLSDEINTMIERNTGVRREITYSKVQARKQGAGKGKYKFFVPYGAEDFRGLTQYVLAGKGKQGEADQKWFEDNLVTPYTRGVAAIEMARQALKNDYRFLLKTFPDIKKNLDKEIETGFTLDQTIRIYLYNKSGFDVPGISKRDLKTAVNYVNSNPDIKTFADSLQTATKKGAWVEPEEFWDVGSILKDLNNIDQKVSRKEFLAEWIENVDTIFDEKTLNKLEAIYGTKYREALENIIKRMKSGSNRPADMGGLESKWMNWVNNSVGTIMFFNRRSALLQMISFTNFVNWSDNNPAAAAAAFANQKEYWKAWVEIFNSDKLKQRRGGLKSDIQEQEIANQAKNSKDKLGAVISYLLKIGFTPTQIADNIAISTGGATLLINRTKTYQKQGMSYDEARAKAFEDFSKISDETQQSGDPMLISQQQASHLGRLILAFQNTPMQYTRLMKKAGQDIINGRGDLKTNMSKIAYYGFVQNLIFTSLQQALFALLPEFDPEDDEEKYQRLIETKQERIINGMIDTILRGSGLTGAVVSTLKNAINRYYKEEKKGYMADHTYTLIELANVSPPIGSKARKVYNSIQTMRFNEDVVNERGFSVVADGNLNISPAYEVLGNLLSAGFNIPLDRAVIELNSIAETLDNRNTSYQRIALLLGWRTWDVNAKNEENEMIELVYEKLKEIERRKKKPTSRKPKPPKPPSK